MDTHKPPIWTKDLITILFVNFFLFGAFQMTLPTLPLFIQEIGLDDRYVGLIVGIFTFSALLLRPIGGQLLDSIGRGPVFITGLIILVVSLYSLAFSVTLALLLIVRIVQGVGWGLTTTATGTIATDLVPVERRGEGLGFFGISGNLALAIGPAFGLFLVDHISFKSLFLICGTITLIGLILASTIKYVKPMREKHTKTLTFDVFEKTAIPAAILLFFVTFTFGGIATFLPPYTFELGFDSSSVQIYFVIYALSLLSTRLFAGQLYDRRGMVVVFIPGIVLIVIAMVMLSMMTTPMLLYIAAIFYGFGFGLVQPALQAYAVQRAALNRRGMANATFFSAFDVGVGLGAMSFGFISNYLGYSSIYVISAVSAILSLTAFLIMKYIKK